MSAEIFRKVGRDPSVKCGKVHPLPRRNGNCVKVLKDWWCLRDFIIWFLCKECSYQSKGKQSSSSHPHMLAWWKVALNVGGILHTCKNGSRVTAKLHFQGKHYPDTFRVMFHIHAPGSKKVLIFRVEKVGVNLILWGKEVVSNTCITACFFLTFFSKLWFWCKKNHIITEICMSIYCVYIYL